MSDIDYKDVAKQVIESADPGGEIVKIIQAIDDVLPTDNIVPGFLITQQVPEKRKRNPVVYITVFTNTETDFPCDNREDYIRWVKAYAESLGE
jgi:L-fucose mutarotase/ribose pyranase (RbsD/FucU family)